MYICLDLINAFTFGKFDFYFIKNNLYILCLGVYLFVSNKRQNDWTAAQYHLNLLYFNVIMCSLLWTKIWKLLIFEQEIYVFRIKTCKICIQRRRLFDNQLIITRILVRRFCRFCSRMCTTFHLSCRVHSAIYTGNTQFWMR